MLWRDSVELDELRYPILIENQRLLIDTEGAGRMRGAPAALVEYGPTDSDLEVVYASDGSINPPRGVRGGHAGQPARARRRAYEPTARSKTYPTAPKWCLSAAK